MLFARLTGALLVLAVGAVHLYLYFDYFHLVHIVGVLFVLNAAGAAVIGALLAVSARPLVVLAGLGFAAVTLVFFLLSVYHGLFGYTEHLRGGWQEAAGGLELAAIVVLAPLLASSPKPRATVARNSL
jgi:uncharacterized membrane protein YvlD (DUF360 family)